MPNNKSVELLKNQKGKDKCPPNKLALYTNINYNNSELGDILLISPNIQLDQQELASYGFDVGHHDGVSCVVNNMGQSATLVAGLNLDGEILKVLAMTSIPSLVDYGWNDATRSVVSAPVELVELVISSQNPAELKLGQQEHFEFKIENKSGVDVPDVTLDITSKNSGVVEIISYPNTVNLPAGAITTVEVLVDGKGLGNTELSVRINTPIGFINQNNNTYSVTAKVNGVVNLTLMVDRQVTLLRGLTKRIPLKITNKSEIPVNGAVIEAESENELLMRVSDIDPIVNIDANDSTVIDIPLNTSASRVGSTRLICSITPPAGYENEGDHNVSSNIIVTAEKDLEVLQKYQASWAGEGGYLYSYMLTLISENTRVTLWELSFQLPAGAKVSENWYESQKNWLNKRESGGNVILSNTSGHTIDPGVELPLQIQLVYPNQAEAYEYIYSLHLRQIR
ncbi:hypothetical protein M0H77_RS04110 [Providencia rettgeri]|nr:hypothetical protein [Providencia rettgeri]EMA4781056.1 hypothetical protein [Providencia rettgeri]